MVTSMIVLNVLLAVAVFAGMLMLLGSGIRSDRRFGVAMDRRERATVLRLAPRRPQVRRDAA